MPAMPRSTARSARSTRRSISSRPRPTSQRSTSPLDTPIAYITQTTLSVDDTRDVIAALEARFTDVIGPDVVRHLLRDAEPPERGARPVQGRRPDPRRRLAKTAPTRAACARSASRWACRAISSPTAARSIRPGSTASRRVGLTAGASAPDELVESVIDALRAARPGRSVATRRASRRTSNSACRPSCAAPAPARRPPRSSPTDGA